MGISPFKRRLTVTKTEYLALLSQIESRTREGVESARVRERFDYHIPDIPLMIEHPEGGTSNFLVLGRNLSRAGVGVLHGGYVHLGSECRVVLGKLDDAPISVRGVVVHCRLITGSCHEIGIRFFEEIDPTDIIEGATREASGDEEETYADINGVILVAESFEPDRLLLEHQLSVFRLETRTAATPGAVLDLVKTQRIDLLLFGLSLTADNGLKTIQAAREAGLTAPILVLTAESNPHILEQARDAGATDIISKPYNLDLLIAQLRCYLGEERPRSKRHSTAASQPGMPPLIDQYVNLVHRTADQIERTYAEEEWEALSEYCRQLKGSGCGYGFQDMTVLAISLLNALEEDPVSDDARRSLDELLACCRSLEVVSGPEQSEAA